MIKTRISAVFFLAFAACAAGCVSGKSLTLPGDLSRPGAKGPAVPRAVPAAAVLDFSWVGEPSNEIGRDYDHVRPIVFNASPGRSMADLVAAALNERGVAAVRAAGESDVPAGTPVRIWGRVDTFRVDVKRMSGVTAEANATVGVTVMGGAAVSPQSWSSSISSNLVDSTPLFLPPESVLRVVNNAANTVADEAARRLIEAGIVAAPAPAVPSEDIEAK